MTDPRDITLLLADQPLGEADRAFVSEQASGSVVVVALNESAGEGGRDPSWDSRSVSEFFDGDQLREDFLNFLNDWPVKEVWGDRTFDDLFRRRDGESLWWTGPGSERHPDKGVFLQMRSVWLARRILEAIQPRQLIFHSRDGQLIRAFQSLAVELNTPMIMTASSVSPSGPAWCRGGRWLVENLIWLAVTPWQWLIRSIVARRSAGTGPVPAKDPVVALMSSYPRHARFTEDGVTLTFWGDEVSHLGSGEAPVSMRHLLHTMPGESQGHRSVGWWGHTAWPALKGANDVMLLPQTHSSIGAYLRSWWDQVAALFRYRRLEKLADLRTSFVFAGADVSAFYIPRLRQAVSRMVSWEMTVDAIAKSLRSAGDVRALLVAEEFYTVGMIHIAAARRLGIPTLGVQHGTLFPMHLIYTLPKGQVCGSPIPDGFAAYGDYAKDVITSVGNYPADRVRVTGGPRFDRLINTPPNQQQARESLELPSDKKVILLATQFYPWFQFAGRAVFDAVADRDDCIVCVKTHPKDVPLSVYEDLAHQAGAENVRFYADRFDDLLGACDVLISGSSTTVFEAIMLGRATICVNFSDEPDRYPYVASGGSVPARNAEQMQEAIAKVLSPEHDEALRAGRARFLAKHAGPGATGQAGRTLSDMVIEMMGEGR
jgi:hypothetical protein